MNWREGLARALYGIAACRPEPGVISARAAEQVVKHTSRFRQLEIEALEALVEGHQEGSKELRAEILEQLAEWHAESREG